MIVCVFVCVCVQHRAIREERSRCQQYLVARERYLTNPGQLKTNDDSCLSTLALGVVS